MDEWRTTMEKWKTILFVDNQKITEDTIYAISGFSKVYLDDETIAQYKNEYQQGERIKKVSSQFHITNFADFLALFYNANLDEQGVFIWQNDTWDMVDIVYEKEDIDLDPLFYDEIYYNRSLKSLNQDELETLTQEADISIASVTMEYK
ncbi:MAG: hypothetical protein HXM41_07475 [Lachnospiraceae bacterium]|nr:hypothetical protein [Lachnospiraceae bacterium]